MPGALMPSSLVTTTVECAGPPPAVVTPVEVSADVEPLPLLEQAAALPRSAERSQNGAETSSHGEVPLSACTADRRRDWDARRSGLPRSGAGTGQPVP